MLCLSSICSTFNDQFFLTLFLKSSVLYYTVLCYSLQYTLYPWITYCIRCYPRSRGRPALIRYVVESMEAMEEDLREQRREEQTNKR